MKNQPDNEIIKQEIEKKAIEGNQPLKLADFEIERVKQITLGTENVVSREIIEMSLDNVVDTLQNGHPLNTIVINESQKIAGYIACEDFEEKVAYIKYMAAENNGDINLFSEVSKLLQKAEETGYEKINFHGWNKDLNEVLKKRYGFRQLRTDSMGEYNVDFLEKELRDNRQEISNKQKEVFKQKNLLRIKNLYIKIIEKSIDLQPNIESQISKSFKNIDSRISSQLDSYSETEQEILKLKLARHFQNNENLDENVFVDAILETPKFIKKDKGSISRLFEIHEQKTIMKIAEMKKARAEIDNDESFNPFEALSQSKSGKYYIARLLNMPHLEEESEYMNHCVGTSDSYINKIKRNQIDILSIRNVPKINPETNKLENDTPLITIEYNRKTGLIEQMKKNNDEYLSSNDPYYEDTLELLGNLHQNEIDPTRNYPISGINESETKNIHVPEKHILLNTGLVALEDYDPDSTSESFIIKCESPKISMETSIEEFDIYAKIPGITIQIDDLETAKKFLNGSISEIKGNLDLNGLTSAEHLVLPNTIGGGLYLGGLSENDKEMLREKYPQHADKIN
ncbi:MAG: PcfJ domain-containing protein [Candidatus Pacebacteria bacterium]|nr:PcfJ domain-containing protein [Candidatus Paceibacterota bacterium]